MTIVPLQADMIDRFLALSAWKEEAGAAAVEAFATEADRKLEMDRLHAEIRQGLAREGAGFLIEAVFAIRDPVQVAALLDRAPADAYGVVRRICDSFRRDDGVRFIAPFSDEEAWNGAISAARRIKVLSTFDVYGAERFSRATAVAGACRRVLAKGYQIGISSFGPYLDPKAFTAICEEIDALVERLGGREDEGIANRIDPESSADTLGREVTRVPTAKVSGSRGPSDSSLSFQPAIPVDKRRAISSIL